MATNQLWCHISYCNILVVVYRVGGFRTVGGPSVRAELEEHHARLRNDGRRAARVDLAHHAQPQKTITHMLPRLICFHNQYSKRRLADGKTRPGAPCSDTCLHRRIPISLFRYYNSDDSMLVTVTYWLRQHISYGNISIIAPYPLCQHICPGSCGNILALANY